uniref:Uncharacterized protein n=1 Tax=Cannabis sativa TaxID=3483 RepID=A0A803QBH0_CANSA
MGPHGVRMEYPSQIPENRIPKRKLNTIGLDHRTISSDPYGTHRTQDPSETILDRLHGTIWLSSSPKNPFGLPCGSTFDMVDSIWRGSQWCSASFWGSSARKWIPSSSVVVIKVIHRSERDIVKVLVSGEEEERDMLPMGCGMGVLGDGAGSGLTWACSRWGFLGDDGMWVLVLRGN